MPSNHRNTLAIIWKNWFVWTIRELYPEGKIQHVSWECGTGELYTRKPNYLQFFNCRMGQTLDRFFFFFSSLRNKSFCGLVFLSCSYLVLYKRGYFWHSFIPSSALDSVQRQVTSLVKPYLTLAQADPPGQMVWTGRQLGLHLLKGSSRLLIPGRPFAWAQSFALLYSFNNFEAFCRPKWKGR